VMDLTPTDDLVVTTIPSGNNLTIEWDPIACAYSYALYRFTEAFGDTTGTTPLGIITTPTSYTDIGALGDDTTNYFYWLLPLNMYDEAFGAGVRFGEFDFASSAGTSAKKHTPSSREKN